MTGTRIDYGQLIERAFAARKLAYAPYSHMAVGAALLTADGRIFGGCNIESASFSPTICAERCAVAQAVAAGCREFAAIAVVGGPDDMADELPDYFFPCGVCRQVLAEFAAPEMPVITARSRVDMIADTLAGLLPHGFGPKNMQ